MWIDDDVLKRCAEPLALSVWIPRTPLVVLGSSNRAESEVNEARCRADGVPVLKRYGGGGTVVLHGGCVVVSVGTWVRQHYQNGFYFQRLNASVINTLAERWPVLSGLGQDGLSDLTFAGKKVGGTSLFRSRNYLLYQASLLVETRLDLIERYLPHPSKEPEYRQGRDHRAFLAGLSDADAAASIAECAAQLENVLPRYLAGGLEGELIASQDAQCSGLLRRVAMSNQLIANEGADLL